MTTDEEIAATQRMLHCRECPQDVRDIKTALLGNGLGASRGLIARLADVEESIVKNRDDYQDLREVLVRIKWTALGAGIGAGLSSGGLMLGIRTLLG